MDPSNAPSPGDGQPQRQSTPPLRRRLSMDEDFFYQRIMTTTPRRPSQPPPYEPGSSDPDDVNPPADGALENVYDRVSGAKRKSSTVSRHSVKGKGKVMDQSSSSASLLQWHGADTDYAVVDDEELPGYSSSITIEGIFAKKHEIENTTKRAEDRQWHNVAVVLNGTALNIYSTKKDWGWGKTRDGPSISPDNPPWIKKSKLEKSYSLLYADAGIAADYQKRRYVIRVRAETDQFLLSCVELSTFVKWLECLFAAIDVALPIDERDFPRDMSLPRIQRIRWFRGHLNLAAPTAPTQAEATGEPSSRANSPEPQEAPVMSPTIQTPRRPIPMPIPARDLQVSGISTANESSTTSPGREDPAPPTSTTLYPNASLDPYSGKWYPEHKWSDTHDMLYAKLCYSNLLFRSPRKSNYIIEKGKRWFVDWGTGKMVRVLPPSYAENDFFGPWQVIHTENRRI